MVWIRIHPLENLNDNIKDIKPAIKKIDRLILYFSQWKNPKPPKDIIKKIVYMGSEEIPHIWSTEI